MGSNRFTPAPRRARAGASKRLFDLALALALGVLLLPLIAAVALAILLRDGRPVFYLSERMSAPGRPFSLWKFRTMTVACDDSGVSGGDKAGRVTGTGRWLRRYRLDELPQLWNVLRGDMSLVGPRPPLRMYVERYPDVYERVLRVPPGITGLATLVYHRHEARLLAATRSAEETDRVYARRCVPRKARLDAIYADHRGVCFDLVILWRTLRRVFGRG